MMQKDFVHGTKSADESPSVPSFFFICPFFYSCFLFLELMFKIDFSDSPHFVGGAENQENFQEKFSGAKNPSFLAINSLNHRKLVCL
jgi:hypothetical protein